MGDKNIIASAISDYELARAFSELTADRWDNFDLTPYMVYLVDVCDASLLPYLAEQFDVEGIKGFEVATTEEQQRNIIKRSIELHKFIGTPWAVKEACRTLGFDVVALDEGVAAPDAEPAVSDWAQFRIIVEVPELREISAGEISRLRMFIEYYKNARSHLVELRLLFRMTDNIITPAIHIDDTLDITPAGIPLRIVSGVMRLLPGGLRRMDRTKQ